MPLLWVLVVDYSSCCRFGEFSSSFVRNPGDMYFSKYGKVTLVYSIKRGCTSLACTGISSSTPVSNKMFHV